MQFIDRLADHSTRLDQLDFRHRFGFPPEGGAEVIQAGKAAGLLFHLNECVGLVNRCRQQAISQAGGHGSHSGADDQPFVVDQRAKHAEQVDLIAFRRFGFEHSLILHVSVQVS